MKKMNLKDRIKVLVALGNKISEDIDQDSFLESVIMPAFHQNGWFTVENIRESLVAIQVKFLDRTSIENFISSYTIEEKSPKKIGLILAGNIPMVGWHDIFCNFLCGNISLVKYSDKDRVLIPWMIQVMVKNDNRVQLYFEEIERLNEADGVIATGSNNSGRYFESYFGKYPNIIRKNRNSVGVLSKNTEEKTLHLLVNDVLSYFGLGCRNVSKVYLQKGFEIEKLMKVFDEYKDINNHVKYRNNYDYNLALFLLNKESFLQNSTLLLKEDMAFASRIATLHYEWFEEIDQLRNILIEKQGELQCIVSDLDLDLPQQVAIGTTQSPEIDDFADGVDTMQFLTSLSKA
jgi:hypothetical protein